MEPTETRTFRAHRGDARERLDLALVTRLADVYGISRTRVQQWIADGRVRINGATAHKPSDRLAPGDEVEVRLPAAPPRPETKPQEMPLSVLYEDEHLLALDKPPGLVVHPTIGHREGTLLNALAWYLKERGGEPGRLGLVSRLDKGTSGVLLVARTGEVHARLARALRRGEKEYLAVVYGKTGMDRGRIDLKILRDPADRRRMTTSKTEGLDSSTLFETLAETDGEGVPLSLLRCRLLTGRTHQIRVHLKARRLPIVGDPVYGEPRWKGIADPVLAALCRDFPRQALHAWRLALEHPMTGERLELRAPIPPDMANLLSVAGLEAAARSPLGPGGGSGEGQGRSRTRSAG
ncbi:MAG TPA: RluA family pseudouridine synthase [Thermoanaerobaculia bacterium]|nr:RluA family pseudouridine synthase [Thermoanaerobaculia bacterium]